ncbi:NAD-dependent epimerase/dehydratase family protein [Streptosporangium lutulentum]|uniref:Nucleoside-diphosphate-sugar epimerase n=1 Tax=Streptosporangium lutulentum TaxID=1461250 RepID=A0ABT9Q6V7_9ACTN|nr:NAD(P)-dependent oxidoreductase [Streptosporangium lutulentum]MDP9841674.1 nucleoside-diphosphate-sugar epimerase [Streptosporangium lutulentum]
MRILLAGATGVIGRRVVPLLVAEGNQVTALTRRPGRTATLRALGAEPVVADAHDREGLAAAVEKAAPDIVMHQLTDLAAADHAANAALRRQGTRNLVDAALAAGVRRMVAQSIAWVYEAGDEPAGETTPLDLAAPGDRGGRVRSVAALEAAVHEMPEWVVLRYGWFYGPGTWHAPDGLAADMARAGKLAADGEVVSFVHADDAATAAVRALTWPANGAVNVCDDEPAPGREWVPAFCAAVGASPPPSADTGRPGWARGADNRHAREHLGWVPRYPSWRDGFAAFAGGAPTR